MHVAAYAWNSAPTDDSDITRSYVAFGLNFRFPMDADLDELPPLLGSDTASAIHRFIFTLDESRQTSRLIIQWINEDRRAAHRERVNATRHQVTFQQGDCVSVRVQHQSNTATNRVSKLEWDVRGPFEVTAVLGHDAYEVRPLGQPNKASRIYKTDQLRKLPPSIQPCNPLDTVDFRYLNLDRAPIRHPYRETLGISSYNHLWLGEKPPATLPHDSNLSPPFATKATNDAFVSLDDLESEFPPPQRQDKASPTSTAPSAERPSPHIPEIPDVAIVSSSLLQGESLFRAIQDSVDRLFFIAYTSEGTMTPTLHLVQANLDASSRSAEARDYRTSGIYYVDFLTRVSADASKTYDKSRWRIIWHEYTVDNGTIVYSEKRREFSAGKFPDPEKYIAWSDCVKLDDPSIFLLGPFDFSDPGTTATGRSRGREQIPASVWESLLPVLQERHLQIPPLSPSLIPDDLLMSATPSKRPRLSS